MSRSPNRKDYKPETAGQGSESLKVSSVQDYTSEGHEERSEDRRLREEIYGNEDGGMGDEQDGNYADYGDYGDEIEEAQDFITDDLEDGDHRRGQNTEDDGSVQACSETALANREASKAILGKLQAQIEKVYEEQVRVPSGVSVSCTYSHNCHFSLVNHQHLGPIQQREDRNGLQKGEPVLH